MSGVATTVVQMQGGETLLNIAEAAQTFQSDKTKNNLPFTKMRDLNEMLFDDESVRSFTNFLKTHGTFTSCAAFVTFLFDHVLGERLGEEIHIKSSG